MSGRTTLRTVSTLLVVLGLAVYIAAKIHFFRHYGDTNYFPEHGVYWILIAAIGLVLLLIEKLSAEKPHK